MVVEDDLNTQLQNMLAARREEFEKEAKDNENDDDDDDSDWSFD